MSEDYLDEAFMELRLSLAGGVGCENCGSVNLRCVVVDEQFEAVETICCECGNIFGDLKGIVG